MNGICLAVIGFSFCVFAQDASVEQGALKRKEVSKYSRAAFKVFYSNALDCAMGVDDRELVSMLLSRGADPDLVTGEGQMVFSSSPLLFTAVFRSADVSHRDLLKSLMEYGVDIHKKRSDGITAISVAGRIDGGYATSLLAKAGAIPVGLDSDLDKAIAVKIDAEILLGAQNWFFLEHSGEFLDRPVNMEKFVKWAPFSPFNINHSKVFKNGFKDVCGNPYIFEKEGEVSVNPETIRKLSTAVRKEFWGRFAK